MRIGSCSKKFLINDVVVVVEDGDGEFVAAQIFPDVFDGIEFGSIGRQVQKSDVVGYAESCVYQESKSERIDDEVRPR